LIILDSSQLICDTFDEGMPSGLTTFQMEDGIRIIGNSIDGLIEGIGKEIDNEERLVFEGSYRCLLILIFVNCDR
jgi:hypothetical protein